MMIRWMLTMVRWMATGTLPALIGCMMPSTVAAQEAAGPPAGSGGDASDVHARVALTAGTLGIGPELGVRLSDHVGVRGSATFLGVSGSYDSDDLSYDGKIKLKSFGAMLDVYPFGGKFHLSAGARINSNRITVGATPSSEEPDGTVFIGDEEFAADDIGRLSGRAVTKRFSPALTLGYAGSNRSGFFFGTEAGVLFQGAYRLRDFRASGAIQNDPDFQAALERERQSLQDDVDALKLWPIAQLRIGWRF